MGHIWIRALGLVPVCKIGLIYGNYWDSEPFSFCYCYLATFSDSSCSCDISLPSTFFQVYSIWLPSPLFSHHMFLQFHFLLPSVLTPLITGFLPSSILCSPLPWKSVVTLFTCTRLKLNARDHNPSWFLLCFLCFYHPNTQLRIFFCLPPSLTHIFFLLVLFSLFYVAIRPPKGQSHKHPMLEFKRAWIQGQKRSNTYSEL